MKLLSVNVGKPRQIEVDGRIVTTSIWKTPVDGPLGMTRLNLTGDEQSDLSVHGGPDKAVYIYPFEHYAFWKPKFPRMDFAYGNFGENLTVEGLSEDRTRIGDKFRIGTATFMVSQPRLPCYKLGIRFNDPSIIKTFLQSRKTGFYFRILEQGTIQAGDAVELIEADPENLTVENIVSLYGSEPHDPELMERAIHHHSLPESWRDYFRKRTVKR